MPVCMRLMVVLKELSKVDNPWSLQHGDFLTSSTGALGRNGTS
jgi:hypothetical protein